jgi:hypothetical protein
MFIVTYAITKEYAMRLSIPILSFLLLAFAGSVQAQTQVEIRWTDDLNSNATGYTVERSTGPGGYTEISRDLPPASRTHIDLSPVLGQENCYVVYTQGVAGPSGFSAPGCVQVGTTPVPPTPGSTTPLACTGMLGEGGAVAVACVPQQTRR